MRGKLRVGRGGPAEIRAAGAPAGGEGVMADRAAARAALASGPDRHPTGGPRRHPGQHRCRQDPGADFLRYLFGLPPPPAGAQAFERVVPAPALYDRERRGLGHGDLSRRRWQRPEGRSAQGPRQGPAGANQGTAGKGQDPDSAGGDDGQGSPHHHAEAAKQEHEPVPESKEPAAFMPETPAVPALEPFEE